MKLVIIAVFLSLTVVGCAAHRAKPQRPIDTPATYAQRQRQQIEQCRKNAKNDDQRDLCSIAYRNIQEAK